MKETRKTSKRFYFIVVVVVFLFGALPILAQNIIYYSYDAAGNRVRREIVLNWQNAPQHPNNSQYYSDQLAEDYRIKIHPSASDGIVRVEVITMNSSYEGMVTAYSLSGIKVQECKVVNGNAYFNLGDSPKGTYILHVDINGKTTDWKIIKK